MPAHPYIRFAHEVMERIETSSTHRRRFRDELARVLEQPGELGPSAFQGIQDLGREFNYLFTQILSVALGVGWRGTGPDMEVRRVVVTPSLHDALLDTELPAPVSISLETLVLPVGGLVVRWPTGRETYLMSQNRANRVLALGQDRLSVGPHHDGRPVRVTLPDGIVWWYDVDARDLVRGGTFFGSVRSTLETYGGEGFRDGIPRGVADRMEQTCRLVLNLLLYLNTADAARDGETTGFARKKVVTDNTTYNPDRFHNYWHLGYRETYVHAGGRRRAPDEPYAIDYRYFRRGHWRNQPVGPGRLTRVRKWIKPHWVGPDDGRILNRVSAMEP